MSAPLLEVEGLRKFFTVRKGFPNPQTVTVRAVDGVTFEVGRGEAFGLVGESGCGKSTVGRALLRLVEPDAGRVSFDGEDVRTASSSRMMKLRRRMQIIFQDPYSSLNPRLTIGRALAEPLHVHGLASGRQAEERVTALLDEVGLPARARDRYPHEFSGGQRQRIGIARALSVEPDLIVADEAVSALDVSVQAQVLLLLQELQTARQISFLFISHDLGVVRYFCQRLAVMYLGRIVEEGPVPGIFDAPLHPYTQLLKATSPVPDPAIKVTFARLDGEVPSAVTPPSGCHFHPRCSHAMEICRRVDPVLMPYGSGRQVACHLYSPTGPAPVAAKEIPA